MGRTWRKLERSNKSFKKKALAFRKSKQEKRHVKIEKIESPKEKPKDDKGG